MANKMTIEEACRIVDQLLVDAKDGFVADRTDIQPDEIEAIHTLRQALKKDY